MISDISPARLLSTVFFGAAISVLGVTVAQAQAGNLPYQAGGAGLSYGARQALLNAKLLNSRPKNLVRGADGSLLDVSRRGSQAFLRAPETGAMLPGGGPRRGWATGLGTGLGWGGLASAYGGALSYRYAPSGGGSESMMQWISMLDMSTSRSYGGVSVSETGGPIDQWTGQNDLG